jgi:hypothetical protein
MDNAQYVPDQSTICQFKGGYKTECRRNRKAVPRARGLCW